MFPASTLSLNPQRIQLPTRHFSATNTLPLPLPLPHTPPSLPLHLRLPDNRVCPLHQLGREDPYLVQQDGRCEKAGEKKGLQDVQRGGEYDLDDVEAAEDLLPHVQGDSLCDAGGFEFNPRFHEGDCEHEGAPHKRYGVGQQRPGDPLVGCCDETRANTAVEEAQVDLVGLEAEGPRPLNALYIPESVCNIVSGDVHAECRWTPLPLMQCEASVDSVDISPVANKRMTWCMLMTGCDPCAIPIFSHF
mmetsp:Transcript_3540/g.7641  ORF Transcript_3540/g.7641 Transcript_3540/m.7641 type:complete len:247 (+) Transcript_3540:1149-1889(+)